MFCTIMEGKDKGARQLDCLLGIRTEEMSVEGCEGGREGEYVACE